MKIKKITAPTMPEAMDKVKKELGPDAVIFHTKKVKKAKFFNLFKSENIEVFAANDPYPYDDKRDSPMPIQEKANPQKKLDWEKVMKQAMAVPSHDENISIPTPGNKGTGNKKTGFNDLDYIESTSAIDSIKNKLKDQGIQAEWVDRWVRMLVKTWYQSEETLDQLTLETVLSKHISGLVHLPKSQSLLPKERLISLVGPTGVGKTTTLAKLAAKAAIEQNQKVAFITIDTYRIAAIDQLKTYAGILNAPFEVVYTPEDFIKALEKLNDADRIFIDTAGRNYREDHYVEELTSLLPIDDQMAVYLVMSATSKEEDMKTIIKQFKHIQTKGLILTKLDETATVGNLLNLLLDYSDQRLAFITNGQDVPDDIEQASVDKMIEQLFKEKHYD